MSGISAYLEHPLWLAPMAGVADRAFRTVCVRRGAGLTCSEMVSAAGLAYRTQKTWDLIEPAAEERRLAVQLFGRDPALMSREACAVAERLGERLAFIDVNMGCPVRKVVKKGEGAALMREPKHAAEIVTTMVAALAGAANPVPVTCKFRAGWREGEPCAVEFAKRLEQAGASLLAVHGRSAEAMYSGQADWGVVADVKQAVSVPVAGSGDVFSHGDALCMIDECGVDAVLVARGARGNPWIFAGISPTPAERIACMREHFDLFCRYEGDGHLSPLRSQLQPYVKGLPGAAGFRRGLAQASTRADFKALLDEALERVSPPKP